MWEKYGGEVVTTEWRSRKKEEEKKQKEGME